MRTFLFILSGLFLLSFAGAQELQLSHSQIPPQTPFAQPFTVRYQLSHPQKGQVIVDETSFPDDFVIQKTQVTPQTPETTVYDFTVIPFTLGKSTFTASFQLKEGDTLLQQASFPLPVEIMPVQTFKDAKLREIRPPFIVRNWGTWLLVLLVIVALIYVLYLWRKRLQKTQHLHLTHLQDTRPSHVIALSKIDALLQSGLWEGNQYKVFYINLVDILREYLQRRFKLDVSAETSAELLAHIKTKEELQTFVAALREFLTASDLIKFAKAIPTEQQRNQHILILRSFVQQTIPQPTPAKEETK